MLITANVDNRENVHSFKKKVENRDFLFNYVDNNIFDFFSK